MFVVWVNYYLLLCILCYYAYLPSILQTYKKNSCVFTKQNFTTNSRILARLADLSDHGCLFYGQILFLHCKPFSWGEKKRLRVHSFGNAADLNGLSVQSCVSLPFLWYISLGKGRIRPQDIHDNVLVKESDRHIIVY